MPLNARPWDESFTKRYLASLDAELVREGKEWRTREAEAGRPSSYEDFCRVRGLCSACGATGIARNEKGLGFKVVGMQGDIQLYGDCEVCGGIGRIVGG